MAITTASRICALLTMCFCLLLQRSSFKTCCATSNIRQKRLDSRYIQEKTKILSSQSSNSRKEIEIDNIKVEIINQRRKHQISRSNGYIPATGDDRDQESYQGCLGDVLPQIQTRADLKIVLRHGDHTNDELRFRNMDTLKRTRINDSIDAAQNGPPHQKMKIK